MKAKTIGVLCALALLLSACSMPGQSEEAKVDSGTTTLEGTVKEISDSSFKEDVLQSKKPAVVDFYATWCGPCQQMAPIMEQLSSEYKDKVVFFKINVDKNQELSQKFMIEKIPAFKIFKNGMVVYEKVGFTQPAAMREELDKVLK